MSTARPETTPYLRVIACEIAFREICYAAARSPNVLDLEFLPQGYHDVPGTGRMEIQKRIDAVPAGKYDAILIGYGLCSTILTGLTTAHTPLVIPRAHDCITLFLGSKERYQDFFTTREGSYYYTSGWLECQRRREGELKQTAFLPAHAAASAKMVYEQWVQKYGEEQAQYLMNVMGQWAQTYNRGVLIDFDFTKPLGLREQVQKICDERGWQFEEVEGDLGLLQRWLDGNWWEEDFLVLRPGEKVAASYDEMIIRAEPAAGGNATPG